MTNEELVKTLKTASVSVGSNIALAMLLILAAERIETLDEQERRREMKASGMEE